MSTVRYVVSILLATAVLVGIQACAGGEDGELSYDQAVEVYRDWQQKLELPATDTWAPLPEESNGVPYQYLAQDVEIFAQTGWLCAWKGEWVDAYGTSDARAATALSKLEGFAEMNTYKRSYDDAGRSYFDDLLAKARLGDPAPMKRDVELNCTGLA